jgi:hypothetical protein
MKRFFLSACLAAGLTALAASTSQALDHWQYGNGRYGCWNCGYASWNGGYYHTSYGMPVALVIPPTAEYQTHWGWGVGNTRVTPNVPQFGRNWPGPAAYDARAFQPTPPWPSDTDQFGVYYVRGPW